MSASTALRRIELIQVIIALRIDNPASMVLLGGKINALEPGVWERVGADAGAADLDTAKSEVERLLKRYQLTT